MRRTRTTGRKAASRVGAGAVLLALALSVGQAFGAMVANADHGYTATLTSPDVPNASTTFTWEIDGHKVGPGLEISHIELTGCWDGDDIASVSSTTGRATSNATTGVVKVEPLSDDDLPFSVTIVFKQSYGSSTAGTTVFFKTGNTGQTVTTGGPVCETQTTTPPTTTPPTTTPPTTTPPTTTPPTTTPPPGEITVDIVKSNDADEDGTYTNAEEAPEPGSNVSFHVAITNTSDEAVTITSLTDAFPGTTIDLLANKCSDLAGVSLDPGESVDCTFSVQNYSPEATATATINTATVCVENANGTQEACDDNNSRVTSAEVLGGTVTNTPTRGPTRTPPGGLAFTGPNEPSTNWIVAAFLLLLIGTTLIYFGTPPEEELEG